MWQEQKLKCRGKNHLQDSQSGANVRIVSIPFDRRLKGWPTKIQGRWELSSEPCHFTAQHNSLATISRGECVLFWHSDVIVRSLLDSFQRHMIASIRTKRPFASKVQFGAMISPQPLAFFTSLAISAAKKGKRMEISRATLAGCVRLARQSGSEAGVGASDIRIYSENQSCRLR
jgi:hypothetical protein